MSKSHWWLYNVHILGHHCFSSSLIKSQSKTMKTKLFENLLSCYFETICDMCLGIIQKHPIRAEFNFTINQSEQSNWSHDRLKTNNRVQSIIANCRQECNVYVGERWIDAKSQHKIISWYSSKCYKINIMIFS